MCDTVKKSGRWCGAIFWQKGGGCIHARPKQQSGMEFTVEESADASHAGGLVSGEGANDGEALAAVAAAQPAVEEVFLSLGLDNDAGGAGDVTEVPLAGEGLKVPPASKWSSGLRISLVDLDKELNEIIALAHEGKEFDETRLDFLVKKRAEHPDVLVQMAREKEAFLLEHEEFIYACHQLMMSFVPPDVHKTDEEGLKGAYRLSHLVARRIKQKQCLWLIRMEDTDIGKIHESDLFARYVHQGQSLDVVEMAALYWSVPVEFAGDSKGLKTKWRASLETNLFSMLKERKAKTLPAGKLRHSSYKEYGNGTKGPVEDMMTLRQLTTVVGTDWVNPRRSRKSFADVCGEHSILSTRSSRRVESGDSQESESEEVGGGGERGGEGEV